MLDSREKEKILRDVGYHYHFVRSLYFNRAQRKIFSVEAIDDHDLDWLRERIEEPNSTSEWLFFFNSPPSDEIRKDILRIFQ